MAENGKTFNHETNHPTSKLLSNLFPTKNKKSLKTTFSYPPSKDERYKINTRNNTRRR